MDKANAEKLLDASYLPGAKLRANPVVHARDLDSRGKFAKRNKCGWRFKAEHLGDPKRVAAAKAWPGFRAMYLKHFATPARDWPNCAVIADAYKLPPDATVGDVYSIVMLCRAMEGKGDYGREVASRTDGLVVQKIEAKIGSLADQLTEAQLKAIVAGGVTNAEA